MKLGTAAAKSRPQSAAAAPTAPRLRASAEWVTGITRGREGVTVVTLEHRGEKPVLRALVRRPIGVDAADDEVAAATRAALAEAKRAGGRLGRIVAAMPARTTVIRQAQFPQLAQGEMVAAIQGEARRHIPLDLREAGLDFQVVAQDQHQQQTRVVLVAAPRRAINEQVEVLERIGAEPWVVDAKPLAAINALMRQQPLAAEEALGLLEVSPKGATLTLVTDQGHLLTRGVGLGYAERDPGLAPQPFDPNAETVEESAARIAARAALMRQPGQARNAGPSNNVNMDALASQPRATKDDQGRRAADSAEVPVGMAGLERLAQDVRRSITFFQQVIGHRATMRLYVVGAAERRAEVSTYLSRVLSMKCLTPDPLANLDRADGVTVAEDATGALAQDTLIAVGLALRTSQSGGVSPTTFRVNLYMERGRRQQRQRKRMLSTVGASALVMVNALALAFLLVATHAVQGYVKADAKEIAAIKQRTEQLVAASGARGAARHTLDVARSNRPVWSPALASVAGAEPGGVNLTAVSFTGGLPTAPDDTASATLTIRGEVEGGGADPYAVVTRYVEALRTTPAMQRSFPVVKLSSTWEDHTGSQLTRNFEIVCTKKDAVQ